jgi:hypothetical protein
LTLFWLDFSRFNRNMVQPKFLIVLHLINAPQVYFDDRCFLYNQVFSISWAMWGFIQVAQVFLMLLFSSFFILSFKIQFFLQLIFFSILPYIAIWFYLRVLTITLGFASALFFNTFFHCFFFSNFILLYFYSRGLTIIFFNSFFMVSSYGFFFVL